MERVSGQDFANNLITIIKNRIWVLIVLLLLILGASVTLYLKARPYYTSKALYLCKLVKSVEGVYLVNNVQDEINAGNWKSLAQQFSISVKQMQMIKSISGKKMQHSTEGVEIELSVYDVTQMETIEAGLTRYLNLNKEVRRVKELNDLKLEHTIQDFERNLLYLDSLKSIPLGNSSQSGIEFDVAKYAEVHALISENKRKYEFQKGSNEGFFQITSFSQSAKAKAGPSLKLYILVGLLAWLILGTIIVVGLELRSGYVASTKQA